MGKINGAWYAEFYAPVESAKPDEREEFYVYAAEAITAMRQNAPDIPMTLIGDFNAHIKDHYSTSTNDNGRLLNLMLKE